MTPAGGPPPYNVAATVQQLLLTHSGGRLFRCAGAVSLVPPQPHGYFVPCTNPRVRKGQFVIVSGTGQGVSVGFASGPIVTLTNRRR